MSKKQIGAALTALLLTFCFAGCGQQPDTAVPTATTETGQAAQQSISGIPKPVSPGSSLIDYDPSREIYFTCENMFMDIYFHQTSFASLKFFIFSKSPIDTDSVDVIVPVQNRYKVTVYEYPYARKTTYMAEKEQGISAIKPFDYGLYQVYCGMDYKELGELYRSFSEDDLWTEEEIAEFDEANNLYAASFRELTEEDLPEFYVYIVDVFFDSDSQVTEAFQEIDIVIGSRTYHQKVGEIRLNNAQKPLSYPVGQYGCLSIGQGNLNLYTGGISQHASAYDFTAETDMTLTGFRLLGDHTEVLDIFLQINGIEFGWDGKSPIDLSAGDHVRMNIVLKNPVISELSYHVQVYGELICLTDGKMESWPCEINLCLYTPDPYLMYAIIFDGLDLESCYRDYYFPCYATWLDEYVG